MARRKTPRRNSRGQFVSSRSGGSRKRSRGRGRSFRGLGNMITVRPSTLGALQGREMLMESVLPHLAGGGLSAITLLGLRYFVDPTKGNYQHTLVKYAPAFGGVAGALGATVLYYTEGKSAAVSAMISTAFVTAAAFGADYLAKDDKLGPRIHGAMITDNPDTAAVVAEQTPTETGVDGLYGGGVGAIVPEYRSEEHTSELQSH